MELINRPYQGALDAISALLRWWRADGRQVVMRTTAMVLVCLVFGMASAILPWWLVLAALVGVTAVASMFFSPLVGLIFIFVTAFQSVPGVFLRDLPLGSVKLHPYELALIPTMMGIVYKAYTAPNDKIAVGFKRFGLLTMVVLAVVGFSAVYGRWMMGNKELAFAEARHFVAFLLLPWLPFILTGKREQNWFNLVVVASGVLVSVYVIVQMFSGFQLLAMRMEDLEFSKNPGVTRSITGVSIYIQGYAIYWLGIQASSSKKYKLLSLILLLVGVLGVLGTYTRGAWIALGFGGLLVSYLYGRMRGVFAYTSIGLISLALVLGGMFVVKPKVANALVDRFTGIGQEISGGASFGWRLRENQAALDAMAKHPLMGVGLGGAYKPNLQTAGGFMNDEYFIHNSYLSVPTKMGLPGLFMMLYVFVEYFKRFLKAYKNTAFWGRPENIVGFGVMAAFMIGGIEGPTLAKFEGALLYCILLYGITMLSREPESLT